MWQQTRRMCWPLFTYPSRAAGISYRLLQANSWHTSVHMQSKIYCHESIRPFAILNLPWKTCSRILLNEEQRREFLPRFRRLHLENAVRQKLAREVNVLCRKAVFCPYCRSINGSVKKTGPLRIQHDRFRAKKTADYKQEWEGTFKAAMVQNKELVQHLGKAQEELNALRAITLFRHIPAAVRFFWGFIWKFMEAHSPIAIITPHPMQDCELLGLDPQVCRPEEFVWTYLSVPPVSIRPSVAQEAATCVVDNITQAVFHSTY